MESLENTKKLDTILALIESKKIINGECWETTLSAGDRDYVFIKFEGKLFAIHRISCAFYHHLNLDNSEDLVLHSCNNKKCWNPLHLRIGTNSENRIDYINSPNYIHPNSKKEV